MDILTSFRVFKFSFDSYTVLHCLTSVFHVSIPQMSGDPWWSANTRETKKHCLCAYNPITMGLYGWTVAKL